MATLLSNVTLVFATNQGQGVECGSEAKAEKQSDTAIGQKAHAKGDGATAVGSSSEASQQNSTAIGRYAKANGYGGTAIGTSATTMVGSGGTTLDTAIGYYAKSLVWGSVALGSHSKADIAERIAGYDPESGIASMKTSPIWRSTTGAVSVGDVNSDITRQIVGVAAGFQDTDAVNVAQLKALEKWVKEESGTWKLSVSSENTTQVNNKYRLGLDGGKNIRNVAEGKVTQDSTDAMNGAQLYTLNDDIAKYLGGGAAVREDGFFGPRYILSKVSADGIVGQQPIISHDVGNALTELDMNVRNVNSHLKYVSGNFTEAIDKILKKFKHNTLLWNRREKAFLALHTEKGERKNSKLTFLMDGNVAPNSTDAVTGHQLWVINEEIDSLKDKVNNIIISGGGTLIAEGAVTYDKDKDNSITLVGTDDDTPVTIDNVADGKVEKGSKQVVNGGQLKEQMSLVLAGANKYTDEKIENIVGTAFIQAHAYSDMKFEALSYRVGGVQKEAKQAAAIGLAVASLHYINTPGTLSIAFGSGVWRGQSALAFGTGYMSEDGTVCSNFSVTTSGGHWGIGAGLSFALK
ncbi:YadA-like family protein [Bartonella sp. WD12.1]|uniref:YadA-like family protein n=1 Tax=Bartonella sp. WD12.1 TaxID=1933903 RepID=UPI0009D0201F|nr:YadA-like family protein [Bartonella sp. WD12.1]OPB29114.1 Head domain of trimeric autotransporter adhesin [Bartonella sp. WD12.1]